MKYKVFVKVGPFGHYDEYTVYSHRLAENFLVLNLGRLNKSQGPDEIGIPISGILGYHTGDMDD
jgi:hypothetical protein